MREIREIQVELQELADVVRHARARLIRLGEELDRDHMSRKEAKRRMAEGSAPPNLPCYLVETLDLLEVEELNKAQQILHQASSLDDQTLAKIWSERHESADPERPT